MGKIVCKCTYCGSLLTRYQSKSGTYFCNNKCKAEYQRLQKPITKEELYNLYIEQGLSANKIAKIVHRDSKRVWEWLKEYDIPTRPRGTDYGQQFHKGEPSRFKGKHHSEEAKEKFRQARIKDGHVPYLIKGIHWLHASGRKPASWKGGVTPERQIMYSSDKWKRCVKEVWRRDNATCQRCGKQYNLTDRSQHFHIHHMYSFANYPYLRMNPDNLVLLCPDCHRFVHSKENIEHEFITKPMIVPKWLYTRTRSE